MLSNFLPLYISDGTDSELLHTIIWGLKDAVKSEVMLRDPKTLTEVEKMALDINKRLKPI